MPAIPKEMIFTSEKDTLPKTKIAPEIGIPVSFWDGLFSGANC